MAEFNEGEVSLSLSLSLFFFLHGDWFRTIVHITVAMDMTVALWLKFGILRLLCVVADNSALRFAT